METKLTKGNQSNYEIVVTTDQAEQEKFKEKILKRFGADMKIAGFRKGHVPTDIIEKNIEPHYIKVGIYEEIINAWLKKILDQNKEIKFIWEPYGISDKNENNQLIITFKLDVYPEVVVKDNKWEKEKIPETKVKVEKKEVDEAFINLKKNYADYKDTDTIKEDTVSKISFEYLNKKWEQIDKGTSYVWEPEFKEFDFFKTNFLNKKRNEEFELKYEEKKIPPVLLYNKWDDKSKQISNIKFTITDIKKIVLPDMTEETIKKLFWPDTQIKNEKELIEYIENSIKQSKEDAELVKNIESYINKIRGKSISVSIPKTLVDEEQKSRIQSLEQRFWSKEKVDEYFKSLGEEKSKAFLEDIQKSAIESLEKFFVLQKIVESLQLDVDRRSQEPLHIEKKLYAKFHTNKEDKKEEKNEKKKKESSK